MVIGIILFLCSCSSAPAKEETIEKIKSDKLIDGYKYDGTLDKTQFSYQTINGNSTVEDILAAYGEPFGIDDIEEKGLSMYKYHTDKGYYLTFYIDKNFNVVEIYLTTISF